MSLSLDLILSELRLRPSLRPSHSLSLSLYFLRLPHRAAVQATAPRPVVSIFERGLVKDNLLSRSIFEAITEEEVQIAIVDVLISQISVVELILKKDPELISAVREIVRKGLVTTEKSAKTVSAS